MPIFVKANYDHDRRYSYLLEVVEHEFYLGYDYWGKVIITGRGRHADLFLQNMDFAPDWKSAGSCRGTDLQSLPLAHWRELLTNILTKSLN